MPFWPGFDREGASSRAYGSSGNYTWGMQRKEDAPESPAFVYLVTARGSALLRIGLARDPGQRLRELQVGSPLQLELAHAEPCADRLAAEAIVEELDRRFAERRSHGRWYRLAAVDVRSALANPTTLAAPATAAAARERAAAEQVRHVAAFKRRRGRGRARTEKELAYQRRRQRERAGMQRQAARLLARGRTQAEAAAEVNVSPRTLRNWKDAPTFERALARERARLAGRTGSAPPASRRSRRRRQPPLEQRPARYQPEPAPDSSRQPKQSDPAAADAFVKIEARRLDSYANFLDSNDARRGKLSPAEIRARERKQK
jgi:Helix-turn-helix domain